MIKISFKKKSFHLFGLLFVVLLYGIYSFYDDVSFYFTSAEPKEIGNAMSPNENVLKTLKDGDYIRVKGIRAVQGGSLKKGFWNEKYTLFYLTGSNRFIAIQKTPEEKKMGPEYVTVEGRVYSFKTNNYAKNMSIFFKNQLLIEMSPEGFLIQSGQKPGENTTVVVMFLFLILLFLINIGVMVKQTWFPHTEDDMEEWNG